MWECKDARFRYSLCSFTAPATTIALYSGRWSGNAVEHKGSGRPGMATVAQPEDASHKPVHWSRIGVLLLSVPVLFAAEAKNGQDTV